MIERTILVVEDGTEYVDAFRRLAPREPPVEFLHATDGAAARRALADRIVDGVFLDVSFDRTPPDRLVGNLPDLVLRYSGDWRRALQSLARQQGFYIAHDLAGWIKPGTPVLIAWDFRSEPGRLEALRQRLPGLSGLDDGSSVSGILARLLA